MQLLSCSIALGGDDHTIVVREYDTAITFPELLVLKALHGGENIRNIKDAGEVERDSDEERQRLLALYGGEVMRQVFPVEHQPLPEHDARMKRGREQDRERAKEAKEETDTAETPEVLRHESAPSKRR